MTISAIAVSPATAEPISNAGSATVQDPNPTYTETSAALKPTYAKGSATVVDANRASTEACAFLAI
jgi:hypothetical protein